MACGQSDMCREPGGNKVTCVGSLVATVSVCRELGGNCLLQEWGGNCVYYRESGGSWVCL